MLDFVCEKLPQNKCVCVTEPAPTVIRISLSIHSRTHRLARLSGLLHSLFPQRTYVSPRLILDKHGNEYPLRTIGVFLSGIQAH